MKLVSIHKYELDLDHRLQWLTYSSIQKSFITGDENNSIAVSTKASTTALNAADFTNKSQFNLPLPANIYEELTGQLWHGFLFLKPDEYVLSDECADEFAGDHLRTLVFGPDYGHCVKDPKSNLVFSLSCHEIVLMKETVDGLRPIDSRKTRGKEALAYALHPKEKTIVYGDNYGTFFQHTFSHKGICKGRQFAVKERKASCIDFINRGNYLLIGGMGYLCLYLHHKGKLKELTTKSLPVRDFLWLPQRRLIIVNEGLHGLSVHQLKDEQIANIATFKSCEAIFHIASSPCENYLALTYQGKSQLEILQLKQD